MTCVIETMNRVFVSVPNNDVPVALSVSQRRRFRNPSPSPGFWVRGLHEQFLDADGSGYLEMDELKQLGKTVNPRVNMKQVRALQRGSGGILQNDTECMREAKEARGQGTVHQLAKSLMQSYVPVSMGWVLACWLL